jgi:hypothetical protein
MTANGREAAEEPPLCFVYSCIVGEEKPEDGCRVAVGLVVLLLGPSGDYAA